MERELEQIFCHISGNVLAIGLNETQLKKLEKNPHIHKCTLMNSIEKGAVDMNKKPKKANFNIRNVRKKFHKKKVDFIICNLKSIYAYRTQFIKDSIYITKNTIYYFGKQKNYDLQFLKKRYQSYHATINEKWIADDFCITISKAKTSRIKDVYFKIIDSLKLFYEWLSDFLF